VEMQTDAGFVFLLVVSDTYDEMAKGTGDHKGQGGSLVLEGNQWRRGRRQPPPLNFGLSENLLLVKNFSSKHANFEAEKLLFWGNVGSKLKS